MTTLLDAARQALPGLEWSDVGSDGVPYVYGKGNGCEYGVFDLDDVAEVRADAMSRRDALDAALGEPQHLGTSARDWCGMWDVARLRADAAEARLKTVIASWPAHYHRQGCPWGACNCGADAANAARTEARRMCGVDNA
jgi:hypothetical protein